MPCAGVDDRSHAIAHAARAGHGPLDEPSFRAVQGIQYVGTRSLHKRAVAARMACEARLRRTAHAIERHVGAAYARRGPCAACATTGGQRANRKPGADRTPATARVGATRPPRPDANREACVGCPDPTPVVA